VIIITPKSGLITGIVALWARHYASFFFFVETGGYLAQAVRVAVQLLEINFTAY
jgi:hypothetical protein